MARRNRQNYCGSPEHGFNRRQFIQGGVASALGVSLGGMQAAYNVAWAEELKRQKKQVLLLWLAGGASQFETWDPKPGKPTGGPFKAIPTSAAGVHICELMPKMAKLMDQVAIVRSLDTKIADHGQATSLMETGKRREPGIQHPDLGAVVSRELGERDSAIPNYVSLYLATEGHRRPDPGFLGGQYAAMHLNKSLRPDNIDRPDGLSEIEQVEREDLRRYLSEQFDRERNATAIKGYNNTYARVRGLMKSDTLFDLNLEPDSARDRYGPTDFGQHTLIARRLIEAGVPMVKVARAWWDSHADNFESHRELVAELDHVMSTLLIDLKERGLLDSTLVITLSEFGRTPDINKNVGRDHFASAWSCSFTGCGIRAALFMAQHPMTASRSPTAKWEPATSPRPSIRPLASTPRNITPLDNDPYRLSPKSPNQLKPYSPELDITKLKVRASHKHAGAFYSLCVRASDMRIFVGSSDYSIYTFDPTAEKLEPLARWQKHDNYVSALVPVICGGKEFIVSGSYDKQLMWWDGESAEPTRSVEAHQGWIRDLAALPAGTELVSVGDDMLVKFWDATSGALVRSLDGHAKTTPQGHVTALYVVAVTPDGKYVASGDRIGEVRVWEAETGKLAQVFQVPVLYTYDPKQRKRSIGGIRSLAFSNDGKQLAVGGIGQIGNVDGLAGPAHVEVWDWQTPQLLLTAGAEGHKAIVQQLRFHPVEPWLVGAGGGSDDGLIAFWKSDGPAPAEPTQEKSDSSKPASPIHRVKNDLHIHRFCFNRTSSELFIAGHGRFDIWSAGS